MLNYGQNKVRNTLAFMFNEIGEIKNKKDITKVYKHLKDNFQQDKTNTIEKNCRTS